MPGNSEKDQNQHSTSNIKHFKGNNSNQNTLKDHLSVGDYHLHGKLSRFQRWEGMTGPEHHGQHTIPILLIIFQSSTQDHHKSLVKMYSPSLFHE